MPGTSIENEALKMDGQEVMEEMFETQEEPSKGLDLSFIWAQTGSGSVDDYKEHTLNFNKSEGMARVVRGLTGMIGELNYAIVDILVGVLHMWKGAKNGATN
jgi:hypothetical protein